MDNLDKIILDSRVPAIDGNMRIAMEQGKRAAQIDRSFTCFKGVGSMPMSSLAKCTWLGQEKREEEYI